MLVVRQKTLTLYWTSISSPRGDCIIMSTEAGVCWTGTPGTAVDDGLFWVNHRLPVGRVVQSEDPSPIQQAADELRRYFAGEQVQFTCPLDLHGTPFQLAVWQELQHIPYGKTRSYKLVVMGKLHRPLAVLLLHALSEQLMGLILLPLLCHAIA